MIEHSFTPIIEQILSEHIQDARRVFDASPLLQYINIKTRSADRGSKSRASFGNLYAIYVLVEDYVTGGFHTSGRYSEYDGAVFSNLFRRQRELPFGAKLQNHALNHRLNQEFQKYFPTVEYLPILRDPKTNRYWFNENLLKVNDGSAVHNIAPAALAIIDAYVKAKQAAFDSFIDTCERLRSIEAGREAEVPDFIRGLLRPTVDARLFEIVSFAILKAFYGTQIVYFGFDLDSLTREPLQLFKTGRTNANDGGIDFVMRPLGRFFQVTETLDTRKYFLDIDKLEHYPVTFVIKAADPHDYLLRKIEEQARHQYSVDAVVRRYMACIEEVINVPELIRRFESALKLGLLDVILDEIILQSKVEFNYPFVDEDDPAEAPFEGT